MQFEPGTTIQLPDGRRGIVLGRYADDETILVLCGEQAVRLPVEKLAAAEPGASRAA